MNISSRLTVPQTLLPQRSGATKSGARIKKHLLAMAFALPFLAVFAVFFVYPFISGIRQSFVNRFDEFVWLENYKNVLFSGSLIYREEFWRGLKNTLLFVVISVPTMIIVPLFIALLIDIEPRGYKIFRAVLFMPTVFSITSVVLMFRRVLEVETGFINSFFKMLGWRQIDFLGSQPWAWISILLVTVWWTMGTNMVILGAGLKNIDRSMYEAASIDGASYLRTVRSITLPSLTGQTIVVLVLTVLASFNLYGQPALLTSGGPARSTQVLLMVIMTYLYDKPHIAATMSLLLGLIMVIISLAQALVAKLREKR